MADQPASAESLEAQLRLEKLRLEIATIKESQAWNQRAGRLLPVLSTLVPVLALLFTVQQFRIQQRHTARAIERQAQSDERTSQRGFMQPVLTRQMDIYLSASSAVATLASSSDPVDLAKARNEFWRLYWGPLVMLESPQVSGAMKAVGACLRQPDCSQPRLQDLSLALSSSLQADYFSAWSLTPQEYAARSIDYAALQRMSPR
jgi:hypothetical protein